MAAWLLIFIKIMEFNFRVFSQPKKRWPVDVLARAIAAAVPAVACGENLFLLRGLGLSRRMRQRRTAHPAETILGTVVVPAVGTPHIHSFQHISLFRWQKGCCRWKLPSPEFVST